MYDEWRTEILKAYSLVGELGVALPDDGLISIILVFARVVGSNAFLSVSCLVNSPW
jgi:hypothetical protein